MQRGRGGLNSSWVVTAVALLLGLVHLGRPGLSADEGSTLAATGLSWSELGTVIRHLDLVHATYYAVLHLWVDIAGTSAFAVRLPSVVFIAGACGLTAAIAARLDGRRTGWYAGGIALLLPGLTWPGLDARPAALAILLAVLATWLLLRADGSRARWVAYAICLFALVVVQLLAVLIVIPHAFFLTSENRRRGLLAAGAALAALVPFVIAAQRQAEQVGWLANDSGNLVSALGGRLTAGPTPSSWGAGSGVLAFGVLALVAVAITMNRPRLAALLVWAWAPPLVVVAVSLLLEPMYAERYVAWCLPAFAVLAGRGLSRFSTRTAGAVLMVLALCAVPAWWAQRGLDSKGQERTAELAALVQSAQRPGGAVIFLDTSTRTLRAAYPQAFDGLADLSRAGGGRPPDRLLPRDVSHADALRAVARSDARSVVVVYRNRAPWKGREAMQLLAREGCRQTRVELGSRNAVALWECS